MNGEGHDEEHAGWERKMMEKGEECPAVKLTKFGDAPARPSFARPLVIFWS